MIHAQVVLQPVGRIVLVPLQGPVGAALLDDLRDAILGYVEEHGARGIVLDFSGIEVLDLDDFERLRMVVESATLMGSPIILAAIRPGVAAGLTMLGADAGWVRAVRTVEQGMGLFS